MSQYVPGESHGNLELIHEDLEGQLDTLLSLVLSRVSLEGQSTQNREHQPPDPKWGFVPQSSE